MWLNTNQELQKYTTNRRKLQILHPKRNFSVKIWCRFSMGTTVYYKLPIWSTSAWKASTETAITLQQHPFKSTWKQSPMLCLSSSDTMCHVNLIVSSCNTYITNQWTLVSRYLSSTHAMKSCKGMPIRFVMYVCPIVSSVCSPHITQELGKKISESHTGDFW
jgi:hypothetical protein